MPRDEDEIADAERRRIARRRAAGERLQSLIQGHLEARLRDDAECLDVHVGAGQQQGLLGDRRRRRDAPAAGIRGGSAGRPARL